MLTCYVFAHLSCKVFHALFIFLIVRCHKASPSANPTFHSIDTRPSEEGGAVFKTGEQLGWFDY